MGIVHSDGHDMNAVAGRVSCYSSFSSGAGEVPSFGDEREEHCGCIAPLLKQNNSKLA